MTEATENTSATMLALKLLCIECLPEPRMDGYDGDPYLTKADYTEIYIIVSKVVTGLTAADWWAASCGERYRYMLAATESEPLHANANVVPKKRTGRPKATEKSMVDLVIAALSRWHGYGEGGSVTNYEPATNRRLAEQTPGLASNGLCRFLADRKSVV